MATGPASMGQTALHTEPQGSLTGMAKSPYDMFATDPSKETDGIIINYSDQFWLKVSRAGGANSKFKKVLADKLRPHRRAIQTETLSEETADRLLREAVVDGLLLGWGTGVYPEGAGSIPGRDGPMAFSRENALALFSDLPELFRDVYEQASRAAAFRAGEAEQDAGN